MIDRRPLAESRTDAVELERVDWHDPRAVALRAAMDDEIGPRYAGDVAGFDPDARAAVSRALAIDPDDLVATLMATVDGVPAGHAALRRLGDEWELKRVVTLPEFRGRGVSRALITEIERLVVEQGGTRLILQTGHRQPEAVRLYEWLGYRPIPVYPPYDAISFSHCYARDLV
ncbi:GNAT superfamily N-acetyltransferase [Agromyces sp. 3263]|uniref:GNAT family N-acetyltransferase n=1 Tax=Agromyces sp. 3263 TaxID=2817750 RepID=UPI002863F161|nr:GNAT family N-acetyltransferase [Agromyces sp. 3263]MDR6907745.1 GNAT superfamily N-acetyltransferase [Agromyces sp. 3263]